MKRLLCVALTLCGLMGALRADDKPTTKLKGLLVTGGCCHDYENQKRIITEGLGQRVSISFDVVHEGGGGRDHKFSVYQQPGWAKKYDVVVHNECFGDMKDDALIKSVAQAHFEGVPGVFIHCSLHSYRNAPVGADSWRELLGVTSRRHEKQRAEMVRNIKADHPVMLGFPKEWKTPNGELYVIEKVWPNCTPLAQALGEDTKQDHTVIWTNQFGKARVFGTSLGHHNETMNTEEWLGVVSRGVLWSVDKLDDQGKAKAGFEGTGIKPIKLAGLAPKPEK